MLQQHKLKKPRRAIPYPGAGSRFYISTSIWEQTLLVITRYRAHYSEGLVFWGGIIGATGEVYATTLYIPNHSPQGARARPDVPSMRKMVRSLHARDEKLVAQIHSHPDQAFHSFGDDENAASYHEGYISIVIPRYGQGIKELNRCGIFEFDGNSFQKLSNVETKNRFVIQEQVVFLAPWKEPIRNKRWKELRRKLKLIVHRKL